MGERPGTIERLAAPRLEQAELGAAEAPARRERGEDGSGRGGPRSSCVRSRTRLPSDAAVRARLCSAAQEATVARVRPRASLGNHRTIMKVATSSERLHTKAFDSASRYDASVELPPRAQKNTS